MTSAIVRVEEIVSYPDTDGEENDGAYSIDFCELHHRSFKTKNPVFIMEEDQCYCTPAHPLYFTKFQGSVHFSNEDSSDRPAKVGNKEETKPESGTTYESKCLWTDLRCPGRVHDCSDDETMGSDVGHIDSYEEESAYRIKSASDSLNQPIDVRNGQVQDSDELSDHGVCEGQDKDDHQNVNNCIQHCMGTKTRNHRNLYTIETYSKKEERAYSQKSNIMWHSK